MSEKTEDKAKGRSDGKITVAGVIDPKIFDSCIDRAFSESRARTNSAVVTAALEYYAAGSPKAR